MFAVVLRKRGVALRGVLTWVFLDKLALLSRAGKNSLGSRFGHVHSPTSGKKSGSRQISPDQRQPGTFCLMMMMNGLQGKSHLK